MALDLGELVYKLGLDTRGLDTGVTAAKKELAELEAEGKEQARDAGEKIGTELGDGIKAKAADVGKAAGAALGLAISAGLIDNINVDAGNRRLAAQLGLNQAELAEAGDLAGRVYADNFGDSLGQVNDAVRVVLQNTNLQLGDVDTEPAVAKVLTLADVFEQDLAGSAAAAGQMVRTGMAKDVSEALDVLTVGLQGPANKADDLMETMNEYGTQFRKLGLGGADAVGLMSQALAAGARDGDVAADALKEFSIRAIDGSDATKAGFEGLGLSAGQMAADIAAGGDRARGGLEQVLQRLREVEDPARRSQIAVSLFGTQAEDLGDALYAMDVSTAVDGLGQVEGAADRVADSVGSGPQATIEGYKRKLIDWGRSAIEATGPTAAVAAAVGAFGPAALSVLGPLAQLIAARALQTTAATTAAGAETAASGAVVRGWVMSGAAAMRGAARMAASWLIAIGPIAIVIAAIAGVAFLVWKNWDKIKQWTGAAWDWVVDKVRAVPKMLVAFFLNFTLPGLLLKHWGSIRAGAQRGWDAVLGFVKGIPGRLVAFFLNWTLPGLVIKHWDTLKAGSIAKATELVNWVKGLPGRLLDSIGDLGALLKSEGIALVTGLWDGISSMGDWLRDKIIGFVADKIPGPVKKALGISSPSRVMADLARWIPVGVAAGIDENASVLDQAVARMAARVTRLSTAGMTTGRVSAAGDDPGRSAADRRHDPISEGAWLRFARLLEELIEVSRKSPERSARMFADRLNNAMVGGMQDAYR